MSSSNTDAVIIGGGVIGLSCALALLKAGRRVTVLERGNTGCGSSHGNCGTITPSLLPLTAPGTIGKGLRWLMKPDAPLRITPTFDLRLIGWLLEFSLHCNNRDYQQAAKNKAQLLIRSREILEHWIRSEDMQCEFCCSGHLTVYREKHAFREAEKDRRLWEQLNIEVETLNGDQCREREPALNQRVIGGYFHPGDAHLRPDRYLSELARVVKSAGGTIHEHSPVINVHQGRRRIEAVETPHGSYSATDIVLAAGAWSPQIARPLGLRIPIQPGKGYSITYSLPARAPKLPLVLKEPSVCVTTWGSGYRLGSTMEFSGYDDRLNQRRIDALRHGAEAYLVEPTGPSVEESWFGWRPMTVDDLPILGRTAQFENLVIATGHGMLGMSLSAITGNLIADIIDHRSPVVDIAPFSPARFQ